MTRMYEDGVSLDLSEEQWAKVQEIKNRPPEARQASRMKMSLLGIKGLIFDVSRYEGGGAAVKEER